MYKKSIKILQEEKPQVLFCTSQRTLKTLAVIIAARDLGIPTVCFIFSWDNIPKGTKILETDYYLVWSSYMKNELLSYYPRINSKKVMVTGTPQFEAHFNNELRIPEIDFFKQFNLDLGKQYLCFSGDDITTSPGDPEYLRDVARTVRVLNSEGYDLGLIFRRAPVDISGRYDEVVAEFSDVIVSIDPAWDNNTVGWNEIIPNKKDLSLQANIARHTFMVVNLGSSMVFDYISHGKPCAFINYNPEEYEMKKDVSVIYSYVHFRSMPNKNSVLWINAKKDIKTVILNVLNQEIEETLNLTKKWFQVINEQPADKATARIASSLKKIASKHF